MRARGGISLAVSRVQMLFGRNFRQEVLHMLYRVVAVISRDVVINTNSRTRHGQSTADPVVFLLPHIHTAEVQKCYTTQVCLSAWFCSLTAFHGHLHQSNGHADDPKRILTASS